MSLDPEPNNKVNVLVFYLKVKKINCACDNFISVQKIQLSVNDETGDKISKC